MRNKEQSILNNWRHWETLVCKMTVDENNEVLCDLMYFCGILYRYKITHSIKFYSMQDSKKMFCIFSCGILYKISQEILQ